MSKKPDALSCIKTVPIFKNLNDEEMEEVIMIASHKKLEKGDFIYTSGDTIDSLYVIHQGKIKITRYTGDGKEQVIRMLSHGDFLGELALFNDSKMNTYAEALEPAVVCLVDREKLKNLMKKSPELTLKMMNELSNRLEKAEAMIEHNSLNSASARLARLLLTFKKKNYVRLQTTKVNLASNLGMTPETFSRKLKELEKNKLIKLIDNKTIKILDNYGLKHLINPDQL